MIGIMGAMQEEVSCLIKELEDVEVVELGMRKYYKGSLFGKPAVIVFSRWGKVAAASTVVNLVLKFNVKEIYFTGVAGAIHSDLNVGDVIIGNRLFQHDMDASPLIAPFEIPLLGKLHFQVDENRRLKAEKAAKRFLSSIEDHISKDELSLFEIDNPKVVVADVASGDQFVNSTVDKVKIHDALQSVQCVEMEGAAVAQVCFEMGVPFTLVRTISDVADEQSAIDFPRFTQSVASQYSKGIIREILIATHRE